MARPGLMRHRKFVRFAQAVGSTLLARGALEVLWDHAYETGDDYLGTAEDIETLVGWTGERGRLAAALADAGGLDRRGFIEPIDNAGSVPGGAAATTASRYRIHDLSDHAPIAVRRKLDRRRTPSDPKIASAYDTDAARDLRTYSPSLFSTEDQERNTDRGVRVPAGAARADEPVLLFPVIGRGSSEWPLMPAQVEEWRQVFPGLDVLAEARKALGWIRVNLGRRKTFDGMPRFLYDWFKREVNANRRSDAAPVVGSKLRADGLTHRSHEVLKGLGRVR